MTSLNNKGRRYIVVLTVPTAIALLWRLTAGDDAEVLLWRHYSAPTAAFNLAASALIVAAGYIVAATRDRARRLARVALAGVSTVVGVAFLEIPDVVLGHDYGRDFGTADNDTWQQLAAGVNRWDRDLIHIHVPHSRFVGAVAGNLAYFGIPAPTQYHVDIAYDKNGFRNDVDLTSADIVAIGDSFVEAALVPQSQTVVTQLARHLNVSVANLGQSHYGPQQELVVLQRYGIPLSPKIVIWFFFGGNDLVDIDAYEDAQLHPEHARASAPLSERSFTRNALMALARLSTPTRRTATATARARAAEFTDADGRTELQYFEATEWEWESHQFEVATRTLQRARDFTRQVGAGFLVVYIPRKLRVYRGFVQPRPDSPVSTWQLNNLPEVLGKWCRDAEIDFLDSTSMLRAAVSAGESVYLPDDVHWNAKGHEVAAAAIARHLLAKQNGRVNGVLSAARH